MFLQDADLLKSKQLSIIQCDEEAFMLLPRPSRCTLSGAVHHSEAQTRALHPAAQHEPFLKKKLHRLESVSHANMIMLMMSGGVLVLQGQTDLIYNMQDFKTALVCDGGETAIFAQT